MCTCTATSGGGLYSYRHYVHLYIYLCPHLCVYMYGGIYNYVHMHGHDPLASEGL